MTWSPVPCIQTPGWAVFPANIAAGWQQIGGGALTAWTPVSTAI